MDQLKSSRVVLVVEDEALIRMYAAEVLQELGFTVIEAADGEAALRILDERADTGVLFTDVNMPGPIDGLKLARLARSRRPELLVVVVSGKPLPSESELPERGCFLPKPYEPHHVASVMRELLA